MTPTQLLDFYRLAEKLKTTLRHSWLSQTQRQESVAEHSWMMGLLALVLMPKMKTKLDQTKVLKMILLHDLAEAVTEDQPVWEGIKNKSQKLEAERAAMATILEPLEAATAQELLDIWEEYEERQSPEALFVKALDTLDVITQHNVADISTWDANDFEWQLSKLQDSYFEFDPFLHEIKEVLDTWTKEKAAAAEQSQQHDHSEPTKSAFTS